MGFFRETSFYRSEGHFRKCASDYSILPVRWLDYLSRDELFDGLIYSHSIDYRLITFSNRRLVLLPLGRSWLWLYMLLFDASVVGIAFIVMATITSADVDVI